MNGRARHAITLSNPALALFAHALCTGISDKIPPADRLELVSYLVTWAIAERATRESWPILRARINEILGSAVASGLDVGLSMPGHTARVDSLPPGGEGFL